MKKLEEWPLAGFIRIELETECWIWTGITSVGYGAYKHKLAHRLSYEFFIGSITENLCVLHNCNNKPCCNPEHLHLGTRADNNREAARDKINKKYNKEKLEEAASIRRMYEGGIPITEIANSLRMKYSNVYYIATGRSRNPIQ